MYRRSLFLVFIAFFTPLAFAQHDNDAGTQPDLQSYTVTLVEFRMESSPEHSLAPGKIAEDFEKYAANGIVKMVETVRLSALERLESNVLFGKTVAFVTGVSETQNGKSRSMTQRPLGTGVKVTVEPNGSKVLLKLHYQASRIAGDIKEDVTPDIETVQIDTELLLKLGMRHVVAGTESVESHYLLVTVTQ